MRFSKFFRLPLILSVSLHLIILIFFFMHFSQTNHSCAKDFPVIQAVAIDAKQLQSFDHEKKKVLETPLLQPMSQQRIEKIEGLALKQVETKNNEVPKIPTQPTLVHGSVQEDPVVLQEPKVKDKSRTIVAKPKIVQIEKKKGVKESVNLKQKEEELVQKRREDEANQLQKELALEAEQVSKEQKKTRTPLKEKIKNDVQDQEEVEDGEETSAAKVSADAGEINKYKKLIIQSVGRRWIMPDTDAKNLTCQLLVHLAPGGIVLSVDILKESGNENLDRSAQNAIMKASPFPVPESSELFDNFRSVRLTFRPQGIMSD